MTVRGEIADIRFRNDENGYTVAVVDADGEPVVVAGIFPSAIEGQNIIAEGEFVVHPRFGRQFKAETVREVRPDTADGMVRYLGSGILKGVGPVLALRMVNAFGDKTFDVMEYTPERLATVPGISKRKALEISEAYGKIKVMQDAVMFLQRYGITTNTAMKIYSVYGKETVKTVSANPYALIEDVEGIGFYSADKIARSMGVEKNGSFRARAGVVFTLKESARTSGNTYLPEERLVSEAADLLEVDEDVVSAAIDGLTAERKLKKFDLDEPAVMLTGMYRVEKAVATGLVKLVNYADKLQYDCSDDIAVYERLNGITFHEDQKKAITLSVNSGATLITGGPGTGKTTIIKCILSVLGNMGLTAALMAPTGRAAKRMSEATGANASTIHRALGLKREEYTAESRPVNADVIIVDEFSMVDVFLMKSLVEHLSPGTRLVMVGDKNQLPSVGAGNVLADIMQSGLVPVVELKCIYRQALESLIVANAHAINRGDMPVLGDSKNDFFFVRASGAEAVAAKTVELVTKRLPGYLGVRPDKIQVLCPMKNGPAGAINLNNVLQKIITGGADGAAVLQSDDYRYIAGDKVMHVVNDYDIDWTMVNGYAVTEGKGIYNGDIGYVSEVNAARRELTVDFEDGRRAVYTGETTDELQLAYAITVHKSQGSEFDAVVIPIVPGSPMIMTRNLLYTAITRAKKLAVLVGEEYNVRKMVKNDYVAKRYSALGCFITDAEYEVEMLFGQNGTPAPGREREAVSGAQTPSDGQKEEL